MIYIMKRNDDNDDYTFNFSKNLDKNLDMNEVQAFVSRTHSKKFEFYPVRFLKNKFLNKTFSFPNKKNETILDKIDKIGEFRLSIDEISS